MTWSTPTIVYSGYVLTAAQWNAYAGSSSNLQFIKNNYNSSGFMTSFYTYNGVASSVATAMYFKMGIGVDGTSFIIPSAWGNGTYQKQVRISADEFETDVGYREIQINTALKGLAAYTSFKTSAQARTTYFLNNLGVYDTQTIKQMNIGDRFQVQFRHNNGVLSSFIMQGTIRKLSNY